MQSTRGKGSAQVPAPPRKTRPHRTARQVPSGRPRVQLPRVRRALRVCPRGGQWPRAHAASVPCTLRKRLRRKGHVPCSRPSPPFRKGVGPQNQVAQAPRRASPAGDRGLTVLRARHSRQRPPGGPWQRVPSAAPPAAAQQRPLRPRFPGTRPPPPPPGPPTSFRAGSARGSATPAAESSPNRVLLHGAFHVSA